MDVGKINDPNNEDIVFPQRDDDYEDDDDSAVSSSAGNGRGRRNYDDDDSSAFEKKKKKDTAPAYTDRNTNRIGKSEIQDVFRLRFLVILVTVASAVVVGLSTYYYTNNSEESKFERQFHSDAIKILDGVGNSLDQAFGTLDSVATTLVSYARETNTSWPFVTLPNYAIRMAKEMQFTNLLMIAVVPVIRPKQRSAWEQYTAQQQHNDWIDTSIELQQSWDGYHGPIVPPNATDRVSNNKIHGYYGTMPKTNNQSAFHLPTWQVFPVTPNVTWAYNFDLMNTSLAEAYNVASLQNRTAVISKPYMLPKWNDPVAQKESKVWAEYYRNYIPPEDEAEEPISSMGYPIINAMDRIDTTTSAVSNASAVVGLLSTAFYWREMISDILSQGSDGIQVVFTNPCSPLAFTYQINGPDTQYLGGRDRHDAAFDKWGIHKQLDELGHFASQNKSSSSAYLGVPVNKDLCPITLHIYPSHVMKAMYTTNKPAIFTAVAIFVFLLTSLVMYVYDATVEARQRTVLKTAERSTAIVSSLFPSTVRDQLYPQEEQDFKQTGGAFHNDAKEIGQEGDDITRPKARPIAELYPDTTVLFADISGFTSWSSVRQPVQVFHLLESIFAAFDEIAKQRDIFKVETIGDCYVAVVGLPTPRKHHAVAMARFAEDCREKVNILTQELDKVLGPGTADLAMRFGLNSGPTTAGVLRGEKTRFQLFGDTVNTAARMESTGERNKIQVTQKTADLIKLAGKGHWLTARPDPVNCKGKGLMTTYWCNPRAGGTSSKGSSNISPEEVKAVVVTHSRDDADAAAPQDDVLLGRLVDWNVDMFTGLLKEIVNHRPARVTPRPMSGLDESNLLPYPIDELSEVLSFPKSQGNGSQRCRENKVVEIPVSVSQQLHTLIRGIANMYQPNPFHNFEHCSHVAMSAKKLLDRIQGQEGSTNAIVSDPLIRFAVVFAALIHDMDHPGVSNAQLIREDDPMASKYDAKSVAEQNSIHVAWKFLMESQFAELRSYIYTTPEELKQFRQIVIHAVMATDLFDKDLLAQRTRRWERAFPSGGTAVGKSTATSPPPESAVANNIDWLRATVVIELILQASDVSHTMQHFTIYQKWNYNLLLEMSAAYRSGRRSSPQQQDPIVNWYNGELWFFDNYVIPLAQKVKDCGAFGASCDEFLDYAMDNRMEWELKGREIVQTFAETIITTRKTRTTTM